MPARGGSCRPTPPNPQVSEPRRSGFGNEGPNGSGFCTSQGKTGLSLSRSYRCPLLAAGHCRRPSSSRPLPLPLSASPRCRRDDPRFHSGDFPRTAQKASEDMKGKDIGNRLVSATD